MNKAIIIGIITGLFFVSFAFAQVTNGTNSTNNQTNVTTNQTNTTTGNNTNSTLDEDSKINITHHSGLSIALDRIRYLITLNKTKKVAIGLRIAEARLEQLKDAEERNDTASFEKAKKQHDETISKVRKISEDLDNKSDEFKAVGQEIEKYDLKVKDVTRKIDIKVRIKGNLTAEQRAKLDSLINSLRNSTEDVKARIRVRNGETEIKIIQRQNEIHENKTLENESNSSRGRK